MSTPAEDAAAAAAALVASLTTPAEVSVDGLTTRARSVADLIAAQKYLAGKAAARAPFFGLRVVKLKPPGAV